MSSTRPQGPGLAGSNWQTTTDMPTQKYRKGVDSDIHVHDLKILQHNRILQNTQAGFRPGYSTKQVYYNL